MSETGHLERNPVAGSARSEPDDRRKTRSFWMVALVFSGLLAIGFTMAWVVYRTYVAYEPKAARHVPNDAGLVVRFDLTHVMFYEPFRRSIFPLVDRFAPKADSRRDRLARRGVRIGADVREVMFASGPAPGDWVAAIGGPLPRDGLGATFQKVFLEEGLSVVERAGAFVLSESGLAFAQADDGTFVLASGEGRLRAALPARAARSELALGAGGFWVQPGLLSQELGALQGSFRTGSVVLVELEAAKGPRAALPVESAIRGLIDRVGRLDPLLERPAEQATVQAVGSGARVQALLPRETVERLFALLAARVPGS